MGRRMVRSKQRTSKGAGGRSRGRRSRGWGILARLPCASRLAALGLVLAGSLAGLLLVLPGRIVLVGTATALGLTMLIREHLARRAARPHRRR